MRSNILYLSAFLFLISSCKKEKSVSVIIQPLQFNINADVKELQEQLKKRNTILVYENSYEGEAKGVKFFYFDDENEKLHYHFEIYTVSNKIKGIDGSISSKQISKDELYRKIEIEILPDFKNSSKKLSNALVKAERGEEKDSSGYYSFKIQTQELQEKLK